MHCCDSSLLCLCYPDVSDGFANNVLFRVAEEIRQRFPRVIGDYELQTLWAYKVRMCVYVRMPVPQC